MTDCSTHTQNPVNAAMQNPHATQSLRIALADYQNRWPDEAEVVAQCVALLDEPGNPFVRERLEGHFTASAWLVSADARRVLLTHHRKLGRWLQLGGHADGERDLAAVALREAEEESGLRGLSINPIIFDLDRHWIPAHAQTPGHWHYDVRYVVRAGADEAFVVSAESLALAWREITVLTEDPQADLSLRRMAGKFLNASGGCAIFSVMEKHACSRETPHGSGMNSAALRYDAKVIGTIAVL